MLPFARMIEYGNIVVESPKPKLLVQANSDNVLVQVGTDLYGFGVNGLGQLGAGDTLAKTTMVHVLSSVDRFFNGTHGSIALTTDGRIMWTGRNTCFPEAGGRTTWFDASSIFATHGIYANTIADIQIGLSLRLLTTSGDFYYTGANESAECGVTAGPITVLTKSTLSSIEKIRGSINGTHFIMRDGDAYFCGANDQGCAGLGVSTEIISTPTKVTDNVYDISSMYRATQWIKTDGSIWYSGYGTYGQLSTPGSAASTNTITLNAAIPLLDLDTPVVITSDKGNSVGVGGMLYTTVDGVRHSGSNSWGRIGRGDVGGTQLGLYTIPSSKFGGVQNIVGYSSISTSSYILTADGSLYACGGWTQAGYTLPDGSNSVSTMKLMTNMPWY